MDTFLLFGGCNYYPSGGWEDFLYLGTLQECKDFITTKAAEVKANDTKMWNTDREAYHSKASRKARAVTYCDWAHIVNMETKAIVLYGKVSEESQVTWGDADER